MKKGLVILSLLLITVGCTTEPIRIKPVTYNEKIKLSDEVRQVQTGDVVIEEGKYLLYNGLELKKSLQATRLFQQRVYIPAQILTAEYEDNKFVYYYGNNIVVIDEIGQKFRNSVGGIKALKKPSVKEKQFQVFGFAPQFTYKKTTEPLISKVNAVKRSDNGFERKIVFSGKKNELLLFKYIERDDSRDNRNSEFDIEFEPSEKILSIKGAAIEIISHSPTELQYKVISGFSEQENLSD